LSCPELLPVVRDRWQQMRRLRADLDALFPTPDETVTRRPAGAPAGADLPRVPGYEVEAVLGRGGVGIVFRARHLRLNRTVALKMLLGGDYAGSRELARFQREAEAVAGLRHPNVVQAHDIGDCDGRPYFTMELVDGGSLARKLAGTAQPAREAAQLAATLAGAVQAAHASGVVHRDLKPANVLLTADGTPKVTDFGLARRLEHDAGLTRTGVVVGTPSYMAPEQARGQAHAIGPGVDVWALGAILYELLTGRPPFKGETAAETVHQVISQEPVPPSRLNPKVPRDLETICLQCLQKDPGKRYRTAAGFADDLERFLKHEPIRARPVGRLERGLRWVRRRPAAAALLSAVGLFVAAGTVGAWSVYQQRTAAHTRQALADQEVRGILERARGPLEGGWQAVDLARVAEAVSEADRAVNIAHSGGASAAVQEEAEAFQHDATGRLERAKKNRALLDTVLEVSVTSEIRGYTTDQVDRVLALAEPSADAQYAAAFRDWGLDVGGTPEAEVVARLRQEPDAVIQELIAALDAWMLERRALRRPEAEWRRLFRVADRLDHGAQSRQLRGLLAAASSQSAATEAGLQEMRKDIDPRTEPVLTVVLLSQVCAAAGDTAGAEAVLRHAATVRPDQVVLLNELAKHLDRPQDSRLEEAIGFHRAARARRPSLGLALSWALNRAGRLAQGEEVLRELALQQPGNLSVYFCLGSNLVDQGKYAEAAEAYRKAVVLKPDFAEAYSNLGNTLSELRKYGEAEAVLRQAIGHKPDLAPAHMCLGVALYGQQRYGEAEAALRTAIGLKPDFAEAYCNLGHTLRHQGRRDEGEAAYRTAIDLNPRLAVAHVILGGALLERGKSGDAEAEFRKAVELKPTFFRTYYHLGNALLQQRKHVEAEAAYRKAIELKPDFAEAYLNLGTALQEQGRHAEGEAAYRKAVELKPDFAEAYLNLTLALMRRAQFREAATLLKKCAGLVPSGTPHHDEVQRRLRVCERFVTLDARLPAILSGMEKPAGAAEQIEFALLCLLKKLPAAAAHLYAGAFAVQPQLAEDPRTGHRYRAACAAALVGCGRGEGGADLSDAERARRRAQARQWLRADLDAWSKKLAGGPAADRAGAQELLASWREDPDLAGLRDPDALEKLPPAEREDCRALWGDLAALLKRHRPSD
jgi:serine/threonine-protein kinase